MTNRDLKESEVCTDKIKRCSDSRSLQIRASQHKCSTFCTVVDEVGRDELNSTFINENQRLLQTLNLNCCAAVQCTARVSSHNPRIHADNCAIQRPSATGAGSENLRAEIVELLSSITFARVSRGFNGRAHARAPQKFATFAMKIVLWAN